MTLLFYENSIDGYIRVLDAALTAAVRNVRYQLKKEEEPLGDWVCEPNKRALAGIRSMARDKVTVFM